MKTLSRFITKFTSLIVAVLSCFDRVIFKGHLALAAPRELEYFVDCVLKVRRCDFMKTMAPQYSDRLVQACPGLGTEGRPHLRLSHRPVPQGRLGPKTHPRPRHLRGTRRHPLHPRNLSFLRAHDRSRIGLSSSAETDSNGSSITTSSIPSSA